MIKNPIIAGLCILLCLIAIGISGCDASHELDGVALDADICANNQGCYR